jgi:hypothetical protein
LVHFKVKWKDYPIEEATWVKRTELIKDLGADVVKQLDADIQN